MRTQSHAVRPTFASFLSCAVIALALVACGDRAADPDAGGGNERDSGGGEVDSGRAEEDAGGHEEIDAGGEEVDAGSEDPDAGSEDPDAGSEDPDAGSEPVCAPPGIGAACDAETGECQSGLRCYGGSAGDFCSVDRAPDCGGFAHTICPASAPYCLRPIGSSLGACATEEEAICICAIAADKIQPGEGTEGCPSASSGR